MLMHILVSIETAEQAWLATNTTKINTCKKSQFIQSNCKYVLLDMPVVAARTASSSCADNVAGLACAGFDACGNGVFFIGVLFMLFGFKNG